MIKNKLLILGGNGFLGKNIAEIAKFVSEKLGVIDGIVAVQTHFVLKKYKDKGIIYKMPEKDERECVL